jgi:hypothetical protein
MWRDADPHDAFAPPRRLGITRPDWQFIQIAAQLGSMFSRRNNQADFSVVVKRRGKPPELWRWEIYFAGTSRAVVLAPEFYPTVRAAQKAGKEALAALFREHLIIG